MATRYLGTTVWGAALLAASLFVGGCIGDLPAEPTDELEDDARDDDDEDDDNEREDAGKTAQRDGGAKRPDASKPAEPEGDDSDDDEGDDVPPPEADDDAPEGDDDAPEGDDGDDDAPTTMADAGVESDSDGGSDDGDDDSDSGVGGERMDLGKGDGKDVITIGDSWMSLIGTGIQQSLVKVSGQKYRTYGVAGTRLLNSQIPDQYARAKREDPDIKTVVMTGGGNDILMNPLASPPETIAKIGKRLDELWTEMGKDGVQDVVYIEYSEGGRPSNAENVKLGIAAVQPICDKHTAVRCHFMLSDPIIMKQLRSDGIHPTNDGYDKLGKAVHELMIERGMRR